MTLLVAAVLAKSFQLLHEIASSATSIGFLWNPTNAYAAQVKEIETAGRVLGVNVMVASASTRNETAAAFASLAGQQIGALLVAGYPLFSTESDLLIELSLRHSLPASYGNREIVMAGGLMSYAAKHLAGTYAGRILKGEKPAALPVQRSTRLEMPINLKAAKALGLMVPPTLIALADEVIE